MLHRTLYDICTEAIELLETAEEYGDKVKPKDIKGYFVEIQNIIEHGEDELL